MKIIISGGGVAGVTLARFLQDSSFDITLVERAPYWRTIGYAVGIWKTGLDVIEKLKLPDSFWQKVYPITKGAFLDAKGKQISFLDFSKVINSNNPAGTVEREILHSALTAGLSPRVDVKFNTEITNVVQRDGGARVTLSDKTTEEVDLVVIADGIRSSLRQKIFGDSLLSYKWGIWGAWAPKEFSHFDGYHVMSGAGEFLLSIPYFDRSAIGLIYAIKPEDTIAVSPRSQEHILQRFKNLNPQIKNIVSAIDLANGMFIDELVKVDLKRWHKGAVVVIGDAKHGLSPLSGWGTSLALEDAFILAQELKAGSNLQVSLDIFSSKRDKAIRKVQDYAFTLEFLVMTTTQIGTATRDVFGYFIPQWYSENLFKRSFTR